MCGDKCCNWFPVHVWRYDALYNSLSSETNCQGLDPLTSEAFCVNYQEKEIFQNLQELHGGGKYCFSICATSICAGGGKIQKVYQGCKGDSMGTSAQAGGRRSR